MKKKLLTQLMCYIYTSAAAAAAAAQPLGLHI
jgi:hypothetical protein